MHQETSSCPTPTVYYSLHRSIDISHDARNRNENTLQWDVTYVRTLQNIIQYVTVTVDHEGVFGEPHFLFMRDSGTSKSTSTSSLSLFRGDTDTDASAPVTLTESDTEDVGDAYAA